MKYLFTLLFAFALLINVEAQDTGIQFAHMDWETTLKKAKEEDKLIFVDCYTDWCGPCKWMTANVFPDEGVGTFYNDHFINVKIDMEKGEGILFAKAYGVRAYPTLMFIDAKGEIVHQAVGSRPADGFLTLGSAATDPDQRIGSLSAKYNEGNRETAFLMSYAKAMKEAGMKGADAIAEEYLASQSDWSTEDNMKFVFEMADYDVNSKLFQHIRDNRSAYHKIMDKGEVDGKLKGAVYMSLRKTKNPSDEHIFGAYKSVFPDHYRQFSEEHIMNSLARSKDEGASEKYLTAAVAYMDKYEVNEWRQLNSIAWTVYEMTDDPMYLGKARAWAKKSVDLESNYFNNDTLAAICFKLKEKDLAAKHAQIAIDLAKKDGDEAKETKALLEKINAL